MELHLTQEHWGFRERQESGSAAARLLATGGIGFFLHLAMGNVCISALMLLFG